MQHVASSVFVHSGVLIVTHAPFCQLYTFVCTVAWWVHELEHDHDHEPEHKHEQEHDCMSLGLIMSLSMSINTNSHEEAREHGYLHAHDVTSN
jgi:hypothetical protein